MLRQQLLWLLAPLALSGAALAEQINPAAPFSIKNQNPFIQIFGLPPTQEARLLPAGGEALEVALDIANGSMVNKKAGSEALTLDGESYRLSLSLRQGLGNGYEIGAELPLVGHHNGVMDNFIEGWHDFFGLSNSQRNQSPSNVLEYHYRRDGETVMAIAEPANGLGDMRLFAARKLRHNSDGALSLHASLKLPTGSAADLHGSGAADLALSAAHLRERWLSRWRLSTALNGGLLLLGKSDRFAAIQRDAVLFGSGAIIWDSGRMIDLKAQLDLHTSFYRSELDQLGTDTLQLTVGGSIHFDPDTRLDLGVGENLFTDTTPDFLINIALKQRY